jgi:hypothetical protein
MTFVGAAGQNLGLGLSGLTHTPANVNATWFGVYRPDGVQMVGGNCYTSNPGGGCHLNLANLPQTGTYHVYLLPPSTSTLSGTLTLSSDLTGTLVNATPLNVSLPRQGQNARLAFTGVAAQTSTVVIGSLVTAPASQSVVVTVLKPDATQLLTQTVSGSGGTINLGALPVGGTYTVVIDPSYGATATMTVTKTP